MKKILFLLGGSVLVLFVLLTAVAGLFPTHVRISRAIDLAVPRSEARQYLQQPQVLHAVFPGASSITVQSMSDTSLLAVGEAQAAIPMKTGWQLLESSPVSCTLQWYIDFYFDWYPWEKFASLLVESRYGLVLEKQLQDLKQQLETAVSH